MRDALCMPKDLLTYELGLRLQQIYPHKYILETGDYDFDLDEFVAAGRCQARILDHAHAQFDTTWSSKELGAKIEPRNALLDILWESYRLRVLKVTYDGGCENRHYIVADCKETAQAFFARVCKFASEVVGEILVFRDGWWHKEKSLLAQIASASLDNLVLPGALRETLLHDFEGFFESREVYERQGVPWKRGILMLGPPGNGKTHAIKAMVNRLQRPCLYVRSFRAARRTIHGNMAQAFHRARETAPCLLVLEDIDTLVDKTNLSFFLNEMDGFAANQGVLTVATTNHPEKLDSAILERPSRFDRKIAFDLPALAERREFLARWSAKQERTLRLSEPELDVVAERTDGFSFAYLKELGLSGVMAWMRDCRPGGMCESLLGHVEALRAQMKSPPPPAEPAAETETEEEEDAA
ncbi:MAG TPA: ATP-binding protein [Fimbriimonadaceae bacterium]|nr:ATP-binding protein [Fimbriimonadaceae bacterium]